MLPSKNQINPDCKDCELHIGAQRVCLKGRNIDGHRPLMIFSDYPDFLADKTGRPYAEHSGDKLDWMLRRMSVDPKLVAFDYTLRCYAKETLPGKKAERGICIAECNQYRFASIAKCRPRALLGLGTTTLEAFTGKLQFKEYVGRAIPCWEPIVKQFAKHIWIGYNLQFTLFKGAGDTPKTFRALFYAARDAGLKPKLDPTVKPFIWPSNI